MRKVIIKILQILDGTPTEYGKKTKGQSIVEMAIIMPLLIILLTGIAEIGWLANNYLSLQEVTKVGARNGAVLNGDDSPLAWEANTNLLEGSLLPASQTDGVNIDGQAGALDAIQSDLREDARARVRGWIDYDTPAYSCDGIPEERNGFYNIIICLMLDSMDPLRLNYDNDIDDIVVSAFALQTVNNVPGGDYDFETSYVPNVNIDEYQLGYIPIVVGRYPSNANECNMLSDGTQVQMERDPFDYINDGNPRSQLSFNVGGEIVDLDLELGEEVSGNWVSGFDGPGEFVMTEQQRGFAWTGQQKIDPVTIEFADGTQETFIVNCWGSEWSIYDIQERMSLPGFQIEPFDELCRGVDCVETTQDVREFIPSQGMVLVEMWWQHQLLLDLPVFSPVMNALGDDNTTIYVWSLFPAPSVEPNILYQPIGD